MFSFLFFVVPCLHVLGLIDLESASKSEPKMSNAAYMVFAMFFAVVTLGSLLVPIVCRIRWKRKGPEFVKRQCELEGRKAGLAKEIAKLQAEAAEAHRVAVSKFSEDRKRCFDDLVEAVEQWRSAVCNEAVDDFFRQGFNERFEERLKALLEEIQRPFPT